MKRLLEPSIFSGGKRLAESRECPLFCFGWPLQEASRAAPPQHWHRLLREVLVPRLLHLWRRVQIRRDDHLRWVRKIYAELRKYKSRIYRSVVWLQFELGGKAIRWLSNVIWNIVPCTYCTVFMKSRLLWTTAWIRYMIRLGSNGHGRNCWTI